LKGCHDLVRITGIRFKRAGKVYYFDPGELELRLGQKAIVETVRGIEMGDVVIASKMVADDAVVQPLKKVIRAASADDIRHSEDNAAREPKALEICHEKIRAHELPMKLVGAEYTFDNSKVIFYFTAEGRVDFRELVKDLASVFKMRIELRQIGVRDEAKLVGGLGPCGLPMCCTTWLGDFDPVSIKMAKEQNLSLNPAKISGICGRLMCCLKFESGMYEGAPAAGEGSEQEVSYLMREAAAEGKPEKCMKCGAFLHDMTEEDVEAAEPESAKGPVQEEKVPDEAMKGFARPEAEAGPALAGHAPSAEPFGEEAFSSVKVKDAEERHAFPGKEKEGFPPVRAGAHDEKKPPAERGQDASRHHGRHDRRKKGHEPYGTAAETARGHNEPGRAAVQKEHPEEQRHDDARRPFRKKNPNWQECEAREKKAAPTGTGQAGPGAAGQSQQHPQATPGQHSEPTENKTGAHNKNRRRRRGHRKPSENRGNDEPAQGE